jgi:hypothetical protein
MDGASRVKLIKEPGMGENHKLAEQIADEIESLFSAEDEYVSLVADEIRGMEDVVGLRVVANAIHDEIYRESTTAEKHLIGVAALETGEVNAAKLTSINEIISDKAKEPEADFIIAYHVCGTAEWNLTWSADHTREQAIQTVLEFVRDIIFSPDMSP